ncbi:MAG TPA: choice-of-anchor D domain-containing protein [Gaiellaceae bacterium]|nr:choice-of-anchor D domain-containing protein [Gaiellaceae bacterium]
MSRLLRKRPVVVAALVIVVAGGSVAAALAKSSDSPPLFLITPTGLDFGSVPVGSVATQQIIKVKNVSGQSQTMSGTGGAAGAFGGVQNCQGATLAPGDSCEMFYAFAPTATGDVQGSTNGTWNGQPFSLTFSGTGTPEFLITPTSLDFGTVKVGKTSAQQKIQVKNLTDQPVVMSGTGGAAGVFGGVQNCQGTTLPPGHSCQMFYAFTPTGPGTVSGSTNGTWNGQAFNLSFSGTGM